MAWAKSGGYEMEAAAAKADRGDADRRPLSCAYPSSLKRTAAPAM